jgi:hypothetical protein
MKKIDLKYMKELVYGLVLKIKNFGGNSILERFMTKIKIRFKV